MLRHKAMIQAARLAFGFTGIYDEDEAERIKDAGDGIKPEETSPFAGQTEHPERQSLLAEAQAQAQRGTDDYRAWWQSLSAEQRKIIGTDEHERLKALAAETIVAETDDIPL